MEVPTTTVSAAVASVVKAKVRLSVIINLLWLAPESYGFLIVLYFLGAGLEKLRKIPKFHPLTLPWGNFVVSRNAVHRG